MKTSIFIIILLFLSSCISHTEYSGYSLEEKKLSELEVNKSSKQQVLEILGNPSTVSSFNNNEWYYISAIKEYTSFFQPKVLEQKSFLLTFNNDDILISINSYDRTQMNKIKFSSEYTMTEGDNLGIIKQFIGNIGRFKSNKRRPNLE